MNMAISGYYEAKVFTLTHNEMTESSDQYVRAEGTTYQYYKDHDNNSARIKHQVKWHEDAAYYPTKIKDYVWLPENYAGYNGSEATEGGYYWLTSPYTNDWHHAWHINVDGNLYNYYGGIYSNAFAVAPAFCI